ncbi:MAG: hypothetical protein DMG60_11505 [Acidobacteria bacterium]|nr:MAG: hypothetical protein DMG60_11505 [Acidobacteriota bacterium]
MSRCASPTWNRYSCIGREGSCAIDLRHRPHRLDRAAPRPRRACFEFHTACGVLHHLCRHLRRTPGHYAKDQRDRGRRGPQPSIATAHQLLKDSSDMVAPQMITGLLQKVAMTAMPDVMAAQGSKYMEAYAGGFTPEQRKRIEQGLEELRKRDSSGNGGTQARQNSNGGMPIAVTARDVVGENKDNPMVSFYAAAIGVMFLLFTASGAGGSLLDEAESGTLDRVLSSQVTMGTLLAGKLCYCSLLAFSQLVLMFIWAWLVFKLDFIPHLGGFVIMGLSTAFAVAAFGMLLASTCRTRAQLGPLSTLVILIMSSVGGSMFPRFLMPEAMQKAGLLTINAWAIDGFTKVFWRDEPVTHLWPQVLVLLVVGVLFFGIARRLARRWEYS